MAKHGIIASMKALRKQTKKDQKAEKKLAQIRKEIREEQLGFRGNPSKLAKAIADLIRADNRPGEDPDDYDASSDQPNKREALAEEGFHWFQNAWGKVVIEEGSIAPVDLQTVTDRYGDRVSTARRVFEVTCPTTGCVAGWATSLAGYPMALSHLFGQSSEATATDIINDNLGQVFTSEDCIDKDNQRLVSIPEKAAELLGLGDANREWLFSGYRELKQVLWALDKIAETGTFNLRDAERETDDEDGDCCDCSSCRDYC